MARTELYNNDPQRVQHQVESDNKVLEYLGGQHKRRVVVTGPADVMVNANMNLSLSGTGTSADTSYEIKSITFVFDQPEGDTQGDEGGAVMSIEAVTEWFNISGDAGSTLDSAINPEGDSTPSPDEPSGFVVGP